ncbi:MAG: hypothetical protein RBU30_18570 [Polyangia bacterium]|jgi:hypothetical protein|nr:hypothetical protein [Polyangia bacterium]
MTWPQRGKKTALSPTGRARPEAPSTPLPADISSHPAWARYYRGKQLIGIGQALTSSGAVLTAIFAIATPLAVIMSSFGKGGNGKVDEEILGLCVGFSVPILALLYSGISLLVKGKRMRDGAASEIFGPPDPGRPSIRVQLGPAGFGLKGRF